MLIFTNKRDLIDYLNVVSPSYSDIGLVPTMGALHDGHLSLISRCTFENRITVISIFVNPTQFNNSEDLEKYPRVLERDIDLIKTVDPDVVIFTPNSYDIYDGDVKSESFDFDGLENVMEGKFRPGHFNGVATIVKKLFHIVKPKNAYFGEKDFQQLQIIKKMVIKENIPVNMVLCDLIREKNGLAMSSRNERLTKEDRNEAGIIFRILQGVKEKFITENPVNIYQWVSLEFKKHPNFILEYFEITEELTLLPIVEKIKNKRYRAFIAVFNNNVRLIDTLSLY